MNILLKGGQVYSPSDPFATAMLIVDDSIAWVGDDSGANTHLDSADHIIELDGRLVTPGFVDPHVHCTATGLSLIGLDLTNIASNAQLLDAVQAYTRANPGLPVLGHGWDETTWDDQNTPTSAQLSSASNGAMVYLTRIDVHSALVSEELLYVDESIRHARGFASSGHLTTDAHHIARRFALALVTGDMRRLAQTATLKHAAAQGIVSIHEMAGPDISGEDDLCDLIELARGGVTPHVVPYWGEMMGIEKAQSLGAYGAAGDLFVDGAIGSHTACLRSHYSDAADTRGTAYHDSEAIAEHLIACTSAGLQGGFHVIGDAAADAVFSGVTRAVEVVGLQAFRASRHRLEHIEMLDDEQIALMSGTGMIASMQPVFDELWGSDHGMYAQRLGERWSGLNRFADMYRAGIALAFGSDAPVTPLGPWRAVSAAARHHTIGQRISTRAAFNAHTRGAWRAAGVDDAGVLAPGHRASFAIWDTGNLTVSAPDERVAAWSTDPRSGTPGLPDPDAPAPECLMTVHDGITIFDASA